jgi:hypothetical protein
MSEPIPGAGGERVVGALQVELVEAQQVSREVTADNRRLIVVHWIAIVFAVAAVMVSFFGDGGLRLRLLLLPGAMVALAIFGLFTQSTIRRRRVAEMLQSHSPGALVHYELAPVGIEIQRDGGLTQLAWSECSAFAESSHAFLLYAHRDVPQIIYKRAFREDMLPIVRERLTAHIEKRAGGHAFGLALAMGAGLLALGVIVGLAMHRVRH